MSMWANYQPPKPGDPDWIDPEKVRSIGLGAPGSGRRDVVSEINARQRRWDKDGDAYERLRRDGLQPDRVDGSHRLEATS